ncbi:MAG: GGDEF domain-containing protein [Bacilli bacterium]|nr:GGDEF domain-containing protein [Bacilli bacterium]
MGKKLSFFDRFKDSLLDKDKYIRLVRLIAYVALLVVALFMTVLNVVQYGITDPLTLTTGIFSIALIPDFLLTYFSKTGRKIAAVLFFLEFIAMFAMFLYTGKPEGFSAIWIALVPIACMIFYGRKIGSMVTGVMFIILALAFYTPLGKMAGMYPDYTQTFKVRFPILYVAFYLIALFLESIQQYQFQALEEVNAINEGYSTHDGLTGLFNRKGFYDLLESELKTRTYSKIGFIVFDIDFFKKLNDTYGHLAGDEVLIELSHIIKEKLGNSLAACRWGGEEFLVCYVDEQIKKADLEEFRMAVQNHEFIFNDKVMKTTISGGVFETNDKVFANKDEWLKNADSALYNAKETGRNKVVYF